MREIKFRGKCTPDSKYAGEWICGGCVQCEETEDVLIISAISDTCTIKYHVIPDTVGQFTGLKDYKGRDIYEGDIIRRMCLLPEGRGKNKSEVWRPTMNDTPKVISFRNGAFGYVNFEATEYSEEEWLPLLDEDCKVIGNIYDNPELLKKGE